MAGPGRPQAHSLPWRRWRATLSLSLNVESFPNSDAAAMLVPLPAGAGSASVQGIRLEVDRRNVAHWRAGTWTRAVGAAALALPAHATSQSSHPVLISAGPIDSRNAVH